MKLTVTQENLARALNTVSRIANSRSSLPILSNVLLKTVNNQLLVEATNLDVAISETIGAKIKIEGSITVPARLMQDYVSSLPASTLSLEVKDNKLLLSTEHHNSTINGTPADDFPVMPVINNGDSLELSGAEFKGALQQVLFAASTDDSRPVLTGAYLHTRAKKLYIVATDSYRLAEKKLSSLDKEISLLIPASSLQDVLRVMRDDELPVNIKYDDLQARFSVGSVELVTRLIEGKYPDYRKLLPKESATTAIVSLSDLQEITKVSSLFAREAAGSVTVTMDDEKGEISIRSIASQMGENVAVAKAEISAGGVITLNSRYILDALSVFGGEKVKLSMNGKLDPCLMTDPDSKDYLHVIMPVKS